jgi:hypothetical protein
VRFRHNNRARPYIVRHMSKLLRERFGVEVCKWLARAGEHEAGNYRRGGWQAQGYKTVSISGIIQNEIAVIYAEDLERQRAQQRG